MDPRDVIREVDKIYDTLELVNRMFRAEAEMNATKHLAEVVRPHPLAAKVEVALQTARELTSRLEDG